MQHLFKNTALLQNHLSSAGIKTAVIGGLAVAFYGNPRITRDIDLKVLLDRTRARDLLASLPSHLQPLSKEPEAILKKMGFLFFTDPQGMRVDLLLAETSFDVKAIERAKDIEATPGDWIKVCTPEDLIIYKMISTRSRDREDAEGVVKRQKGSLDENYILNWLQQFEKALDDSTLIQEFIKMKS